MHISVTSLKKKKPRLGRDAASRLRELSLLAVQGRLVCARDAQRLSVTATSAITHKHAARVYHVDST
jgi:hypothetical protein